MVSIPCPVCRISCDPNPILEHIVNTELNDRTTIEIQCGCIYHRCCFNTVLKVQIENCLSKRCIKCKNILHLEPINESNITISEQENRDAIYNGIFPLFLLIITQIY